MSDDLISRKETVKMLRDYADLKCFNGEIELANGILKAVCYIENDNILTAYDVGKVIELLKEKVGHAESKAAEYDEQGDIAMMDIWDTKAKTYRNSIKIIKSGGVAND